ncbi:MAG: hypothetical protein K0S49_1589 [Microbacterium sp.]|nr:hypothetical protein [Microbacterium sp.]
MRYCRSWPTASTVRPWTDGHCRLICQMASQSRPEMTAIVASTLSTIAAQRGTRCSSIQRRPGQSSAASRIAMSSGMTRSFSWMMIQIATPAAAATTSSRHEYAVARRRPRGMLGDVSVATVRVRRASKNDRPTLSSLIPSV